jgi:hypothetical protein
MVTNHWSLAMTKVHQFLTRYPTVDGYELICFVEAYGRLLRTSVDLLLSEGLESDQTARFYIECIGRMKGV